MVETAKERTWDRVFKRNLDAAAEHGTDVNDELEKEWPGGEKWAKRFILPFIPKHGTAIELGAGSGRISQWVAPVTKKLYLTDYSAMACDLLRGKFPAAKVIEVSDCLLTDIPDGCADLVYSVSVFGHLFEEQVYVYFREAFAKLQSGGKLSIHLTDLGGDIAHFVAAIPARVDTQRNVFRYMHPDYATAFAAHAGFEDISIEKADQTRAYFLTATKPA